MIVSLAGAAVMAIIIALKLPPEIPAGIAFVLMAVFLGLGTGGDLRLGGPARPAGEGRAPSPGSSVPPAVSAATSRRW